MKDSRIGKNLLPAESDFDTIQVPNSALAGHILTGIASSCEDEKAGSQLFKVGASTGLTSGAFSGIDYDVSLRKQDERMGQGPSVEYAFLVNNATGNGLPWGDPGDSGSFVWTAQGEFLGLIWGGLRMESRNEKSLLYITDASDLFESIGRKTEGCKVRLAMD